MNPNINVIDEKTHLNENTKFYTKTWVTPVVIFPSAQLSQVCTSTFKLVRKINLSFHNTRVLTRLPCVGCSLLMSGCGFRTMPFFRFLFLRILSLPLYLLREEASF